MRDGDVYWRRRFPLVGRKQPARHFDPGGFSLGRTDPAGGLIARNLVELIAVDANVMPEDRFCTRRPSGHSTAKTAAPVIIASTNHSVIAPYDQIPTRIGTKRE